VSSSSPVFPPREEVLSRITAPVPRTIKLVCGVLAVAGPLVFIAGLFVDPTRSWRSLHFN